MRGSARGRCSRWPDFNQGLTATPWSRCWMPAHVPRPMNGSAPFSSWTAACRTGSRSLTSPYPGCATACPTSSTGSSAASRATAPRWRASMRHCRGPGRQPRLAANHRVTDRLLPLQRPAKANQRRTGAGSSAPRAMRPIRSVSRCRPSHRSNAKYCWL